MVGIWPRRKSGSALRSAWSKRWITVSPTSRLSSARSIDHAGDGIHRPRQRHLQHVVVPVGDRERAEGARVLFRAPPRLPVAVGGGERELPRRRRRGRGSWARVMGARNMIVPYRGSGPRPLSGSRPPPAAGRPAQRAAPDQGFGGGPPARRPAPEGRAAGRARRSRRPAPPRERRRRDRPPPAGPPPSPRGRRCRSPPAPTAGRKQSAFTYSSASCVPGHVTQQRHRSPSSASSACSRASASHSGPFRPPGPASPGRRRPQQRRGLQEIGKRFRA